MNTAQKNFVPRQGKLRKETVGKGFWQRLWRELLWGYIDVVIKWMHPKK
jgi:hypothetical protein